MKFTSLKNKVKGAVSYINRRCFSANGFSLLPLALRPRLFLVIIIGTVYSAAYTLIADLDNIAFAAASSLSLTISDSILSLDLKPISESGTFASSGNLTISANTNNYTGYTLKIAASNSGSTDLVDTNGNSFTSIESAIKESTFAGNDISYNNKWGYAPGQYYDSASGIFLPNNNQYFPAPTITGDLLGITNVANNSSAATDNDNYTIAIGARANTSTKASSYEGTFVITAVANATPYTITFDPNTAEIVTNMPGDPISSSSSTSISNSTYAETIALPNTVPERRGYNFLGWCNTQPTRTNGKDICSSTTYNPGGEGTSLSYILNQTADNTNINLYAMWNGPLLYYKVADMVKTYNNNGQPRTQTVEDLKAAIIKPTSNSPAIDSSNSGVFLYNSSVFGEASDASNDYPIYYYRGILDDTFASTDSNGGIGSSGDGYYYPNYVRLGDTCWRIVRTTGSGGTKMIYNGLWTGNTCANAAGAAQVVSGAFNNNSSSVAGAVYHGLQYQNMHAIGYTYSNIPAGTTISVALGVLLGYNGDDIVTNTNSSIIKQYIENAWFNTINNYGAVLEPSAGYCNDRTIYSNDGIELTNVDTVIPYGTSNMIEYSFGAHRRNWNLSQKSTLTCPRGQVDLYSVGADNGNGQLSKPVALLTADEATFAGNRHGGDGYATTLYLRSGNPFWSLSPFQRTATGGVRELVIYSDGSLDNYNVLNVSVGIRPVVSLKHNNIISSGSGTAVDPWVINAP